MCELSPKQQHYWHLVYSTPEYLAPEVIQGNGHGLGVDWWALGVLLFEMLAGYPPFFADNPFTLYQMILNGGVKFPKTVPSAAQQTIRALLTVNRTKRLGCGSGGESAVEMSPFFDDIDWSSARAQLLVPPVVPTVLSDGDAANFDYYDEEAVEEISNLTSAERALFAEIEQLLTSAGGSEPAPASAQP